MNVGQSLSDALDVTDDVQEDILDSTSPKDDLFSGDAYEILNRYTSEDAPFKLVLCVNGSLRMHKGKIAAQCCHAALGAYKLAFKYADTAINAWEDNGQEKEAVQVDTEEEMFSVCKKAAAAGLVTCLFVDEGRTQVAPGSKTVLAIGPAPVAAFKDLTSHLKLL